MILSKISQIFWCGALALAICVPVARTQENAGTKNVLVQTVLASETAISDIDFGATLKAAEAGDTSAQFLLSNYYLSEESDPEKSVAWLTKAAEGGLPEAQFWLGERYLYGDGMEQSHQKALEWRKKAAEQGNPTAQYLYGFNLMYGIDGFIDADPERGVTLISEAATAGDESAQYFLGSAYWCGDVVEQNYELAVTWLRFAAEHGNAEAQFCLAIAYSNGLGVDENAKKASAWLRKAAENDHPEAQLCLAQVYTTGLGVEVNAKEASVWLRKAAENGHARAKKCLEKLDGNGSESEIVLPPWPTKDDDCLFTVFLGDNVSMTFVAIPGGTFTIGSPESEDGRDSDEIQNFGWLSPFWIGQTEVTQAQWKSIMGNNPSYFKRTKPTYFNGNKLSYFRRDSLPVECVSWDEAMEFCRKLTERERKNGLPDGYKFTLPTEAQWEYACRAGTTTSFSFGNSSENLYQYGNLYDRSGDTKYDAAFREANGWKIPPDTSQDDGFVETAPVGSFRPNAWGLYDMHGNVCEWCLDHYTPRLAGGDDPCKILENGSFRVIRGGSWSSEARICRSACRYYDLSARRARGLGFRVALVQE